MEISLYSWHWSRVGEATRIIGTILALGVGALILDYGCYYQATIFTTLDGSGKGMNSQFRDPPYHPFVHPILWIIAGVGMVPIFLLAALDDGNEASAWIFAGAVGSFLFARYWLMRRGIS